MIMVIGGADKENYKTTSETWYYCYYSGKWTPGPTLNTKRAVHGCACFDGSNGKVIAVFGGFSRIDGPGREITNTVEFLDMENRSQGWISGKEFKT